MAHNEILVRINGLSTEIRAPHSEIKHANYYTAFGIMVMAYISTSTIHKFST
jgi:hypothetical protein